MGGGERGVVRQSPLRRSRRRADRRRGGEDDGRATGDCRPRRESIALTPLSNWTWAIAGAVVVFHLATANIYGYHRDEPYYLASGRRLAWGYVDHPPLTPFLYRVSDTLFGSSQFGLRVLPAFLHGGIVLLTALLARELGADIRGQVVAALAAAVAPMLLTTGHFLGTVTPEIAAWLGITLVVVRLLNG